MRALIPKGLRLDQTPYVLKSTRKRVDRLSHLAWIVGTLSNIYSTMDEDELSKQLGYYVPLYSQLLREFIGDGYVEALDCLIECGIVVHGEYRGYDDCLYEYAPGKSNLYALSDDVRLRIVEPFALPKRFQDKVNAFQDKRISDTLVHDGWLEPFHEQLKRLTIRKGDALTFIKQKYDAGLSDAGKRNSRLHNIERLAQGQRGVNVQFKYVPNCGRLFTSLTSVAKDLRPFLYVPGLTLVIVDVKSCQPFIVSALCARETGEYLPCLDASLNGTFYDPFIGPGQTKEDIKKLVLAALFDRHTNPVRREMNEMIKAVYPTMWDWVVRMEKKHGHAWLPIQMQRLEGTLILQRVCGDLFKRYPGEFFATIHDAVVCDESRAGEVSELIAFHALKMFGFAPQTDTKIVTLCDAKIEHTSLSWKLMNMA